MSIAPLFHVSGHQSYGRVYSVTVQSGGAAATWGNEAASQSPLRVAFQVERSLVKPTKAKVAIYNLGAASRIALVKGAPCRIRAGYLNRVDTLFIGTADKIETTRQGPDIVTEMELVDAERFTHMNVLDRRYDPGVRLTTILQDAASVMGINLPGGPVTVSKGVAIGLPEHIYSQGFVATGPVRDTLDKLCMPQGLEWSIQNAALIVIPRDHYDGRVVRVLSRGTGLIGVPGAAADCTTMQSLLDGGLVPGGLVELDSKNVAVSGVYKIRQVVYTGDSHDAAWHAEMEAVSYDGQLTPLPVAQGGVYATAVTGGAA